MKFIQTTRVIVLRGEAGTESDLVAGLKAWRIFQIETVDSVQVLEARLAQEDFDVLVVDLRHLPGFTRSEASGQSVLPQPPQMADMASIVILSTTRRGDIRNATKLGYNVVLLPTASPRMVYRHIATLMQKRRRKARMSGDSLATPGGAPEMQNDGK